MTEIFIEKAKLIHGDKYDYSKVDYKNSNTKVIIICKIHGDFLQKANNHINLKHGCPKCGRSNKSNTIEFIEKSKKIHGDKYDYFKVNYINIDKKVIIICKIHGDFEQTPYKHLIGRGCHKCGTIVATNKNRKTLEYFIEKSRLLHGDTYDYFKADYKSNHTKVIITCKIHGNFEQTPHNHLAGQGCIKCSRINSAEKRRTTLEEFIEKAKLIHGDKYDYSKVDYINNNIKVIITCKLHSDFKQVPSSHLIGRGCSKCGCINNPKNRKTTTEFIEKARLIHGDKYDYSKVDYIYNHIPVIIICKIHGDFLQRPRSHLNGILCPKCSNNGYSKQSILWLNFLSKFYNIYIQHALNDGEFRIPTSRYRADGYCKETNTIYEFYGDYWHGNPEIYKADKINNITKCSFKELYEKTLIKENKIKELGYNLEIIWENHWKKINNAIRTIQRKFIKYYYY